jgi:hypothetical protein
MTMTMGQFLTRRPVARSSLVTMTRSPTQSAKHSGWRKGKFQYGTFGQATLMKKYGVLLSTVRHSGDTRRKRHRFDDHNPFSPARLRDDDHL